MRFIQCIQTGGDVASVTVLICRWSLCLGRVIGSVPDIIDSYRLMGIMADITRQQEAERGTAPAEAQLKNSEY